MTAYTFDQIIDFTRTSAATYVANTGFVTQTPASRNLLTYTQEFDNAAWTKTNATALSVDPAAATLGPELVTNGDFSAGSTGWTDITGSWAVTGGALAGTSIPASAYGPYSNGVATAGRIYLATFTITVASGSLLVRVGNTESSAYTTGGTFSQYFTATSSAATIFQLRAGGAGFTGTIDNISVREVIGGLITAPDGTSTADKIVATATTGFHGVFQSVTGTVAPYTLSVYAKAAEYSKLQLANSGGGTWSATFDLEAGTTIATGGASVLSSSIQSAGSGWYRCSVTFTGAASLTAHAIAGYPNTGATLNNFGASYTGDGTSGLYLWGAQLEQVPNANLTLGSELVTNGDFSSATGWVAGTGWAISSGTANATAASADLYQLSVAPVSLPVCQITFTVSNYSAGTVRVALMGMSSSTFSGNGTYTVTAANVNGDRALYFVVSGFTGSIDNVSVRQVTGTTGMPTTYTRNVGGVYPPRFDYDPVTLAPRGLLIEEQRTNLLTYSEQFDNAAWTKTGVTVSANSITSPDGTVDADMLVEDTSTGIHSATFTFSWVSGTTYTASVFVKAAGRGFFQIAFPGSQFSNAYANFDVSTGALGSSNSVTATITSVGNGWYRCTATATATASAATSIGFGPQTSGTATRFATYTGDGTSGLFLWGAQLEAGAFATSYIPTVASQVTRTADQALVTGANFSRWFNGTEGTFVVEATPPSGVTPSNGRNPMSVNDGTTSNVITMSGGDTSALYVAVSGVAQANIPNGSLSAGATFKRAVAYKQNNFAASTNGVAASEDTSGNIPAVDKLFIGSIGSAQQINGHIRRIRYYPTRLSNTQLQALTA